MVKSQLLTDCWMNGGKVERRQTRGCIETAGGLFPKQTPSLTINSGLTLVPPNYIPLNPLHCGSSELLQLHLPRYALVCTFERWNSQKPGRLISQQALCPEDTDGFNGLIIGEADAGDGEEQRL